MSVPIADGDFLEARFACFVGSQVALNVRHYVAQNSAGTSQTLTEGADKLSDTFHSDYKAMMSSDAEFRGVGLRRLNPNATIEFAHTGDNGPGLVGTKLVPKQVCGIITLQTLTPGQAGRGRLYMPFIGSDDMSGEGRPTAAYLGSLNTIGDDFKDTILVSDGGANSVELKPVLRIGSTFTGRDIIDIKSRTVFGTQRRRGDYGATNLLPF